MRHRPVVRVALCLLGVYLLAVGVPEAIRFGLHCARELLWATASPNPATWIYLYPSLAVLRLLIGLYLLLGGRAVVNLVLPPDHVYCSGCGYDLGRQLREKTCPACGGGIEPAAARAAS